MFSILNNANLLLIAKSTIFYILSIIFFCAFLVVLLWFLLWNKKDKPIKPTKSWTIESAKKFLENNNIEVNDNSKQILEKDKKDAQENIKITEVKEQKAEKTIKVEDNNKKEIKTNTEIKKPVTNTNKSSNKIAGPKVTPKTQTNIAKTITKTEVKKENRK